jgi:hypothetical protein
LTEGAAKKPFFLEKKGMKVSNNEEKVKITMPLPKALKQEVEELAVKERRSMNDQIIVLLEIAMQKREGDK